MDLEAQDFQQILDWNDRRVDWEGRSGDRGLRGIAFHGRKVHLAASDEIFVCDKGFQLLES